MGSEPGLQHVQQSVGSEPQVGGNEQLVEDSEQLYEDCLRVERGGGAFDGVVDREGSRGLGRKSCLCW